MDIVDAVTYRYDLPDGNVAERTRQAYCNLFDVESEDARLVMRHLVMYCGWLDESYHDDPIQISQLIVLRGIIREIKKQLNMGQIEEMDCE